MLALIEPAPPRGPSLSSYVGFAKGIVQRLARRLGHHSSTLSRLDASQQQDYTRLKAKLIANSWALRQYAPQPFSGKLHLFLSTDSLQTEKAPGLQWRNFTAQGTAVLEIPGTHDTVTGNNDTEIDEQGMQQLAKLLQTCLDDCLMNNKGSSNYNKSMTRKNFDEQ